MFLVVDLSRWDEVLIIQPWSLMEPPFPTKLSPFCTIVAPNEMVSSLNLLSLPFRDEPSPQNCGLVTPGMILSAGANVWNIYYLIYHQTVDIFGNI